MGRAARLPRDPEFNRGDAGRMVAARGAAVVILCTDLRVRQYAERWHWERERIVAAGPPVFVTTEAQIEHIWQNRRAFEIDTLADILSRMGVPSRFAAEAAEVLINVAFPIAVHNATCRPEDRKVLAVSVDGLATVPAGRKPRHHGLDVKQWVEWWYRHKIKVPSDSIYALAQEYAMREKRLTRADSVVADGIQRAENLLNREPSRKVPPSPH